MEHFDDTAHSYSYIKIYENNLRSNWVQAKENVRDERQKPKPNQNKKPSRQIRGRKK